jgi:two-component system chemotaxis sensor kinase CheA
VDHVQAFREEALELLETVEHTVLELEADPHDSDNVDKLFRAMHTIKGSGAMFGFDEVARFTHEVETVWDQVRSGRLTADKDLLDLTLSCRDHILGLLSRGEDEASAEASDGLSGRLRSLAGLDTGGGPAAPAGPAATKGTAGEAGPASHAATWWLRYRPRADTYLSGQDPLGLLAEVGALGQARAVVHAEATPLLDALDPEAVAVWWDVLLVGGAGEDALRDVFVFVEDEHDVRVGRLAKTALRATDLDEVQALLAASAFEDAGALATDLDRRLADRVARRAKPRSKPKDAGDGAASIRVEASRLDRLVDLVGELAIIQSRLSERAAAGVDPAGRAIAEELERVAARLRDETLGLRMVPIGGLYGTLRRLVRDLAGELGKEAAFVGEGGDTELDKHVMDQLKDPLVHILRNSLDHGLESPERRLAAGKPAQGTVRLQADHVGGEVRIVITDDGGGIDLERVRQKALEKGLLPPGEDADERTVLNCLFCPGFSTAKEVSSVSGRGVGMDVVKRNIEELGGRVTLESRPGLGTTLTVRLPLTLAIIDGLQVRVGNEDYIIPLVAARACLERFLEAEPPAVGVVTWREKMTPCLSLRRIFGVAGPSPRYERVIMVAAGDAEVGLAVDVVVGQRQAVIKKLSDVYRRVECVSGTTVNGDGTISLILDVARLVRYAGSLGGGNASGGRGDPLEGC